MKNFKFKGVNRWGEPNSSSLKQRLNRQLNVSFQKPCPNQL